MGIESRCKEALGGVNVRDSFRGHGYMFTEFFAIGRGAEVRSDLHAGYKIVRLLTWRNQDSH